MMRSQCVSIPALLALYSVHCRKFVAAQSPSQNSTEVSSDLTPKGIPWQDTLITSAQDNIARDALDPINLAPFTDHSRSVTIPDYTLTDLLFRYVNMSGQLPFGEDAIRLWKYKVPLTPKTKVLYEAARGLLSTVGDLFPLFQMNENGTVKQFNFLSGNDDITTLGGLVSFWTATAPAAIFTNDCDCRGNARQYSPDPPRTRPDISFANAQHLYQIILSSAPEDQPEPGWVPGKQHENDCSPRFFAQGQIRWRDGGGRTGFTYPKTHDVIKAQFEMVVDMLRNETTVATLQSMKVVLKPSDRLGARIIKVAGLSASALGNMHGFLVIRQYALYQALQRGDSACPIPVTTCGKFGSDACDVYPPRQKGQ